MTPTSDEALICHPDTGFISVAGDDACAFLQSIITANVETLAVGGCRPSALLTPQGRVLIDMMVYRPAETRFLLRSDAARRDDLFTRLRRYRLRRAIDLAVEPDIRLVLRLGGAITDMPVIMACADPRSAKLGTHCLVEASHLPAQTGAIDLWHARRIAAGVPEGPVDLTPERALMLEAGLDKLGAVDFEKGCYVGQEVTARTHYRGLVKRRLVPLSIAAPPPATEADIVWNDKTIGTSKSAASAGGDMAICLALLKLSDLHAILEDEAGGSLTVNGQTAALALPDWMLPLPHPSKP